MSAISFRPAIRRNVPLLIGLTSGPGGGKTYSALRIASGIAGPEKRFCAVDTERGRMSHYADDFAFDVFTMEPPFTSERFLDALRQAQSAGYPVCVLDSASHEWMGEGGVLARHDAEMERLAGSNASFSRLEAMNFPAWKKPKQSHNAFVEGLIQLTMPVVLCFRGKVNIKPDTDPKTGKRVMVESPFRATTSDGLPYELTVLLVLNNQRPGTVDLSQPNKISRPVRPFIKDGAELDEGFGAALAAWARGTGTEAAPVKPKLRSAVAELRERIAGAADRAALDALLAEDETRRVLAAVRERSADTMAELDALVLERMRALEPAPA